jgi:hypothetical protein
MNCLDDFVAAMPLVNSAAYLKHAADIVDCYLLQGLKRWAKFAKEHKIEVN